MTNVSSAPTPFGTIHYTATGIGVGVNVDTVKKALQKAAKGHGRALSVREHVNGHTVTVFAIYRKK